MSEGQFDKLLKAVVIFIITSDFEQKILRILAKVFRQAFQNCILPVRKKFLGKKFFRKIFFHSLKISIAWAKLFLEFWLKKVGRLVETACHVWRGTFWEKFFQKKLLEALNIFRNWTEEFWTLTRNFQQFLQNCNLAVQRNNLIKSLFSKELIFQIYFRTLCKNFSAICRKTSGRVAKSALYLFTATFWEKIFSEGRFLFSKISRPFAEKFRTFFEKVSGRVVKTAFYLFRRTICGNFFSKHFVFLNHFWYLTNLLRPICKKFSGRFVQTVFYLSKGNFLEDFFQCFFDKVYSKFEQKLFRRLAKKIAAGFSNLYSIWLE